MTYKFQSKMKALGLNDDNISAGLKEKIKKFYAGVERYNALKDKMNSNISADQKEAIRQELEDANIDAVDNKLTRDVEKYYANKERYDTNAERLRQYQRGNNAGNVSVKKTAPAPVAPKPAEKPAPVKPAPAPVVASVQQQQQSQPQPAPVPKPAEKPAPVPNHQQSAASNAGDVKGEEKKSGVGAIAVGIILAVVTGGIFWGLKKSGKI